jgi:hypothetical protein
MPVDKVVVTNVTVLRAKYGSQYASVKAALDALIAADGERGLTTRLVAIDADTDMGRVKGKAVKVASNTRQVKAAIDAIYNAYTPDYILILGAGDVVPPVTLPNPAQDDDKLVPTDLPYACPQPLSRRPRDFVGPTRVVGRLPDVEGAQDPAYLIKVLGLAAAHRSRTRADYAAYLGVSAEVWRKSTQQSLENLFGVGAAMFTVPAGGPGWPVTQLRKRIHFFNCHGAPQDPHFYGQRGNSYPIAHDATRLRGKISNGAVIAAECCYGGELYDPAQSTPKFAGICSTYLAQGAYGFFGSSTIAYGPSEGNGQADLICQYFIDAVLKGASLGRAALEARQRFVAQYSHVDPTDLKTLLQFNLLGDPAIHPVAAPAHAFSRSKTVQKAMRSGELHPKARAFRRERLARTGTNLAESVGAATEAALRTPKAVLGVLTKAARETGLQRPQLHTYRVAFPGGATPKGMRNVAAQRRERSIHMLVGRKKGAPNGGPVGLTAIIATVQEGKLVHLRRVHGR